MKISSFFKPLSFLPALALMYMIYSFSAQPADSSSSASFYVSRKIVQAVDKFAQKNWDSWEIDQHASEIHAIVRKAAHITEYFLLAIAVSFPFYVYGIRGILLMLLAGVVCVVFACGDEYHQSLVSGRAASMRDVLIDSIGIFFGVILTRLIGWSGRMAITGPMYERRQKKQQQELDAREAELSRREAALRQEELRYQNARFQAQRQRPARPFRHDPKQDGNHPGVPHASSQRPYAPQQQGVTPAPAQAAAQRAYSPQQGGRPTQATAQRPYSPSGAPNDRTRVIGTRHDVDDRTRVYRSEEEQRRMEEAYRQQLYERRRIQSEALQEDSTSDQLSEDLPFSRLFRKKEK